MKVDGKYPKSKAKTRWEYASRPAMLSMIGREMLEPTFENTLEVMQIAEDVVEDNAKLLCTLARIRTSTGDKVVLRRGTAKLPPNPKRRKS